MTRQLETSFLGGLFFIKYGRVENMNIDHLEAFMYVVHLESIHKASEALYLSQPTVTARIKTVKRDLGIE